LLPTRCARRTGRGLVCAHHALRKQRKDALRALQCLHFILRRRNRQRTLSALKVAPGETRSM
jgi:hypothetical protein